MAQSGNCPTASPAPYGVGVSCPEHTVTLDALMVLVSAIMGILAGLLLVRGLLGRLSGTATTHPTVRFFLWVVFALFLPLTSYMFSAAKNSGEVLRPQLILLWMLLAELLRKKLEGVSTINDSPLQGVNKQSTWDAVDQIVRIAWLGYLIYTYAVKWVLVILWAFSIIKVAQRVAAVEVAKRSFALGKNPHLIAGYMRQLSAEEQQRETAATGGEEENATSTAMTACKYVVMGEDKVKRKAGGHGYSLQLSDAKEREKMVTVGDVWRLAARGDALFASPQLKLKDLCLSFALHKLLRKRFEKYPSAEAGRRQSLDFLLCGLLGDDKDNSPRDSRLPEEHKGERVFRVIEDELSFLSDYYFSTIPLMLSNLWSFLLNCVVTLVILFCCCILILIYNVIRHDSILRSLFDQLNDNKTATTIYDPIVTLLLIATLFLLEYAEAVVYMLSDWVMVSLLCSYAKKPSWRRSASVRCALTTLRRVRTCLKRPELKFNQHSVLEPRGRTPRIFSQLVLRCRFLKVQSMLLKPVLSRRFLGMRSTSVPKEVKAAIVKYLVDSGGCRPVPPIGESVLRRNGAAGEELLQACKSDGAVETIIVWHIATCLYEMKHPPLPSPSPPQQPHQSDEHDTQANRRIAETLSKYCTYLVALEPELLPDDTAATATAYKAAVREIQDAILKGHDHKADDFERVTRMRKANGTVAERGAELGHQLVAVAGGQRLVWKVLAELWTEIVVYIAPSDDVKSHAQALAHNGEFITHVWALLTHGGILRWPAADENAPPPPPADQSVSGVMSFQVMIS